MYISVEIDNIQKHCSILQDELKEITVLLEIFMTMYQSAEGMDSGNLEKLSRQLRYLEKEKKCVESRLALLESMIVKFSDMKKKADNGIYEAIELLNL